MKLNNRGFAITTILFGVLIIFLLLMVSMLGILANYNQRMEILIDNDNGARNIVTMKPISINKGELTTKRGYYKIIISEDNYCYKYLKAYEEASCN